MSSYTVIWEKAARAGLKRLKDRDGEDAVRPLVHAINGLSRDPEPPGSSKLGANIRRLRVGRYRATYEIDGKRIAVQVLMVGSTRV